MLVPVVPAGSDNSGDSSAGVASGLAGLLLAGTPHIIRGILASPSQATVFSCHRPLFSMDPSHAVSSSGHLESGLVIVLQVRLAAGLVCMSLVLLVMGGRVHHAAQ